MIKFSDHSKYPNRNNHVISRGESIVARKPVCLDAEIRRIGYYLNALCIQDKCANNNVVIIVVS